MANLLNTIGDALQKGKGLLGTAAEAARKAAGTAVDKAAEAADTVSVKVLELIRAPAEKWLESVAGEIIKIGNEKLDEFNKNTRRNLIISAALNSAMLLCAALTAILMPELKSWGLIAAALINYVVIGRALFNIIRLVRTFMPHKDLIGLLLPVFGKGLWELKSFKGAIKETIRAAVRHYIEKVSKIVKIIHAAGSFIGLFPSLIEIENKAAEEFYPLVRRCMRLVLLYNVLLFTICYGILVFILKYFVLTGISNFSIFELYIYPFRFIYSLITGGA